MAKPTDIKVTGAALYFLPVQTRVPLKFGTETLTEVTCARVRLRIQDSRGRTAEGWGETPKALVVRAADTDVTEADLIAHCRERLARYKYPTSVDWVDSLPRNPSGKVLKKDLRAPYWEGRERFVG